MSYALDVKGGFGRTIIEESQSNVRCIVPSPMVLSWPNVIFRQNHSSVPYTSKMDYGEDDMKKVMGFADFASSQHERVDVYGHEHRVQCSRMFLATFLF